MYSIGQLSKQTGISTQTIRYYEKINLMPSPKRATNGYRQYIDSDVERLRFIRRARQLDFALHDIREILALKELREAPCQYVMNKMQDQITFIEQRITNLKLLQSELYELHSIGLTMPEDIHMKNCICHVIGSTTRKELIQDE